jgi:pimeloyl-[acyl-carrier protein] methyl ester esterase
MPFLKTSDGASLHYKIAGNGKSIIFVHGWAMNSHVWKHQIDELSRDFQVIAVDLRGHGKSECGNRNAECGFDIFVQDLKELTNLLGIGKFTLVGWSMASFVIARYYFKYTEDIGKLIFICGTPKFVSENGYSHGQPMIMIKRLEQNLKRNYESHIKEFCGKFFMSGEEINTNKLNTIKKLMFNEDFPPKNQITLQTLDSLIKDDIRNNLKDIQAPTLIVNGDIDKICPVGAGKYMAKKIQNSKLIILEGIGHAPFLTQPERVNKEIKDFCYD